MSTDVDGPPLRLVDKILALPPDERFRVYTQLDQNERAVLDMLLAAEVDNPFAQFEGRPVEFIQQAVGETVWSKQKEIADSVVQHQRTAVAACHAPGKAVTPDTPVATPSGWVKHGALRPGDSVFDENGQPCIVIAVTPLHRQPTYRVTFADGSHVDAAGPHEWWVRTRSGGRIVETADMVDTYRPNGKYRAARYAAPVAGALSLPHSDLPLDPYTLGYWLGDGDTARPYLTVHEDDLPNLLSLLPYENRIPASRAGGSTATVSLLGVKGLFTDLGLLGHKHIPPAYLRSSIGQREALLAGLMDSDGWVGHSEVCYTTTSATLLEGVLELVRSLGHKPTVRSKTATLNGKECGTVWTVAWSAATSPFRLPRKAVEPLLTDKNRWRSVVSVEYLGEQAVSCIEVDSPNNLYLVGEAMIPTHNSHLSGRIVSWWIATHAPGTTLAITIAPTHRQVRNIIWPHIRRCAYIAKLPGEVLTQTWKQAGDIVAYGFSPSPYDESSVQGIHKPNLLIVVDEAGGIGEVVGQSLEALMTGSNTRLLLLGNPPTDQEDSWFERCYNSPLYNPITISAYDTPNFTGEEVGMCKTCPPQVGDHLISKHLVDQRWVDDVISEFGEDSPFVEARVFARFPRATANKVIPYSWCEQAADNDDPIAGERIRLGIDIAADGGDEFVIARADGYRVSMVHRSSGKANENAVDVANVCLQHIRAACDDHAARGITDPVRVKIDVIGVGWGITSMLEKWGQEGKHKARIVGVNVSERAKDPEKFRNIRSELWWNGRGLLQPRPDGGQDVRLDVDRKVMSQLAGPTFKADSAGRVQIETKVEMKRRGVHSPDRAEAILLALYEPPGREIPNVAPISIGQANPWSNVNFGNL